MPEKRLQKVARFQVLKPAGDVKWTELGRMLRDAQYRVFRLGNLVLTP
jgi:hypothetical protein